MDVEETTTRWNGGALCETWPSDIGLEEDELQKRKLAPFFRKGMDKTLIVWVHLGLNSIELNSNTV